MRFNIGDKIWFKEYADITDKDDINISWDGFGCQGIIKSKSKARLDIIHNYYNEYLIAIGKFEIYIKEEVLEKIIDKSKTRGEIINKLLDEV